MIRPTIVVLSLLATTLGGCTRALPLISHAHVGHSLTSWRDTPGQQGLFVVAEKETDIALQQAELALQSLGNPAEMKNHVKGVTHALAPERVRSDIGLGYGAIRAIEGASEHMVFAAQTDDASPNLIKMTERFARGAAAVRERMQLAVGITELIATPDSGDPRVLTSKLQQTLQHVRFGRDLDGDGAIGPQAEELGLAQLREGISTGLKAEDPPYHPIGRRYLLGLVRLPNGGWAYQFDQSGEPQHADVLHY